MIISILNEKGGCGKTTLSINIARCLIKKGAKVLLVDSDKQASARAWHAHANGELLNVVGIDVPTIDKDVRKIYNYDHIIIDGTPQISPITAKTVFCSEFILIPVAPSPLDIWGSERVANLVEERMHMPGAGLQAAFIVINQKVNTKISKEIAEVLARYNLPTLKSRTSSRSVYASCLAEGSTVYESEAYGAKEAQHEIDNIVKEIISMGAPQ